MTYHLPWQPWPEGLYWFCGIPHIRIGEHLYYGYLSSPVWYPYDNSYKHDPSSFGHIPATQICQL